MRVAMVLGLCLSGYLALAYLILPALWSHYEHQPGLRGRPMTTVTAEGIPGGVEHRSRRQQGRCCQGMGIGWVVSRRSDHIENEPGDRGERIAA